MPLGGVLSDNNNNNRAHTPHMLHEYDMRAGIHVFYDTLYLSGTSHVCEQKIHGLPVQWVVDGHGYDCPKKDTICDGLRLYQNYNSKHT